MAKPLQAKLRVAEYIPQNAQNILDVGCADGTVTLALAELFPDKHFVGIDLDESFIAQANNAVAERGLTNITFRTMYLRDLLAEEQRFDAVIFISVLHEFFSYGEGISSVLKALADANELLLPGGDIIIRDMILMAYSQTATYLVPEMREKINQHPGYHQQLTDFEQHYGTIATIYALNHFLLKYMYVDNWERELPEIYVPVTYEQYENAFSLLGMEMMLRDHSTLPYLKSKWQEDFGFTEHELAPLLSTGFIVARK